MSDDKMNKGYDVPPKRGSPDKLGEVIAQMLHEDEDYAVYVTKESGVRWTTFNPDRAARLSPITPAIGRIRALQTRALTTNKSINRQISLGLIQAFGGEPGLAEETLLHVERRLTRYRAAFGRVRYLLATYVAAGLICAVALAGPSLQFLVDTQTELLNAAAFGSLGALLSVAVGLGGLDLDLDDPSLVRIMLGASRAVFGALSAVFLVLLIRADVVLGFVDEGTPFGTYALALVAGFSEKLVPNLIRGLGDKVALKEGEEKEGLATGEESDEGTEGDSI